VKRIVVAPATGAKTGAATALFAWAALAGGGEETSLRLDQADYWVPAVLTVPEGERSAPAVLLLHGTASQKNEVGDLYRHLADALAARGMASLRIDFAGTGDSPVDYRHYTLTSASRDARTALTWLRSHPRVQGQPVAVIGFSQGGMIAQRLVIENPEVAALVTWSSAATDGAGSFDDFFDAYYSQAKDDGFASVIFPWLPQPLEFDLQWFEEMRAQRTFSAMATVNLPILALAGLADETVPYAQTINLIKQSPNPQSRAVLLPGADHTFNVLTGADQELTGGVASHLQLIDITVDWLAKQLLVPTIDQSENPQE
jgi:pimeloyl-ACP methyl ester carboxylesterase